MTVVAATRRFDPGARQAIASFTLTIGQASWFAALGEPLVAAERDEAMAYLGGLDIVMAPVDIALVPDWPAAKQAADAPDWDPRWWQREESLRRAALERATERLGHDALMASLTRVTQAASDLVHGRAAAAAQRAGIADQALVRAASGAATQACYQAALALAADVGGDHPFAVKFRLFAAGRWPLGIVGGRFFVF